jgi:peptidyl-prolyl cis-trans isomerase B (cyclophilin B)
VFGEVIKGIEVVDKIAAVPTSTGADRDRPLEDVRIIQANLSNEKTLKNKTLTKFARVLV